MDKHDAPQPVTETGLAGEQRGVLRGSAAGILLCAVALPVATVLLADHWSAPETLSERLAFALQANVFIWIWVVVAMRMVSSGRFRSPADIRGSAYGAPSPHIAVHAAFLQNSLEQAAVATAAHLALATLVTGIAIFFIAAAAGLFALGRVAFLIGYRKGAAGRSFGMAVTAVPTVVAYAWAIFLVVQRLLA